MLRPQSRELVESLSPKCAYAFQGERENEARFVADSGVERCVLDLDATTIPGPSACRRQVNETTISSLTVEKLVSKIVADAKRAVRAVRPITDVGVKVELVAWKSRRIGLKLIPSQFVVLDASGVVPGLAERKDSLSKPHADDEIAEAVETRVVIEPEIGGQIRGRIEPRLEVQRGRVALDSLEREPG